MPEEWRDFYADLGVSYESTRDEISKAYKKIVKESHPDAGGGRAGAERFIIATQAWDVLGDAMKRYAYDETYQLEKRDFERRKAEQKKKAYTPPPPPEEKPKPPPREEPKPPPKQEQTPPPPPREEPKPPPREEPKAKSTTSRPVEEEPLRTYTPKARKKKKPDNTKKVSKKAHTQKPVAILKRISTAVVAIHNWSKQPYERPMEISRFLSVAGLFILGFIQIPQLTFFIPLYEYYSTLPPSNENLGSYSWAVTFGAPLVWFLCTLSEYRRRRIILFLVLSYPTVYVLQKLFFNFVT
jgi:curved DNA-binding protein CbpA